MTVGATAERLRCNTAKEATMDTSHSAWTQVGPTDSRAVVVATNVTRRYGEGASAVEALKGVSLTVDCSEFVAMMGPSGSGKSTLLHLLAGLDRPTSGEILVGGRALSGMDDEELTLLRRRAFGFVFQSFNLLPMLTAEENVLLPLRLRDEIPDPAWVDDVIQRVGLTDRRALRPAELSGGQVQRVAIARALVTRPAIVLADEPTGNLDSRAGHEILELLRDSATAYGQTVLMVTHEPRVSSVADRILLLRDGLIVDELRQVSTDRLLDELGRLSASSLTAGPLVLAR
jgi:putative ABC transport system ATP-binding protein